MLVKRNGTNQMDEIENGQYSCVVEVNDSNRGESIKNYYTIHLISHKCVAAATREEQRSALREE